MVAVQDIATVAMTVAAVAGASKGKSGASETTAAEPGKAGTSEVRGPERGKRIGQSNARTANDHLGEIQRAQEKVRQGKSGQIIDSTKRSEQRARTHNSRIRNLQDVEDWDE